MALDDRTREDLLTEIDELRYRLEEAEDTLRAIGNGEVDAFVVSGQEGEQVFTLKGAEQPYRVLVESMNEGAATLAADGTILYCNNCLAAMLQVPLERLIGTRLDAYAAPADRPVLAARLECCAQDCNREEIALINGEGNAVPVLFSCFFTDLAADGGISVVITDLRQQKRNEEIMASEQLARSIIEQAGEAIIVCDEAGRVIRVSRLAHQLCGRNPLLKQFDELFHLLIAETDCLFSVATPIHGGSYESVEVQLERSSDDQLFYLLLNATPLKSEQDRIIGCVVSLVDITERKQAEEALRLSEVRIQTAFRQLQMANDEIQSKNEKLQAQSEEIQAQSEELQTQNNELRWLWEKSMRAEEALSKLNKELEIRIAERTQELVANIENLKDEIAERAKLEQQLRQSQKMESIGLLAGGVAHDFNNLLTGICGYGQIIQDGIPADDELLRESVEQMMLGVDRAAELTRSLLAFSRKQEMNRKPVVIEGIIDNAVKFIRRIIGEDIELHTAYGGKELLVMADVGQIEQVLMNLAVNARDAMTHGGCLTISTSEVLVKEGSQTLYDLTSSGNYSRISIADTGTGIDGTSIERIFEPFYTTKEVGKGTGLGLSIVHGIVKQHEGSILVSSEPGKGTKFDIYLPLVKGRVVKEEVKVSAPVAGGTETLLIAEDEEIVKVMLKLILEKVGYSVVVAGDGNEALARFREHDTIALVLSDMVMPGKNGKEILAEIRKITPGMKFIFISGYSADIVQERGMGVLEEGVELLTKPFLKNDLLRKVREMLDRD